MGLDAQIRALRQPVRPLVVAKYLARLSLIAALLGLVPLSICLGLGHGFYAIARNTLPLTLFGVREYGTYLGRMMLPQNIVNAMAPIIFATIISRFEPIGALWLASTASLTGFIAVLMLNRACRS